MRSPYGSEVLTARGRVSPETRANSFWPEWGVKDGGEDTYDTACDRFTNRCIPIFNVSLPVGKENGQNDGRYKRFRTEQQELDDAQAHALVLAYLVVDAPIELLRVLRLARRTAHAHLRSRRASPSS